MAMTGGFSKLVASGTPSGWPDSIKLYIYYKEKSQDVEKNETILSLGVYLTTQSGYNIGPWDDFNGSYVGTATSGSDCKTFNGAVPSGTMGTKWLAENLNVTIKHNDDGTKKATIYWKWGVNSPWGKITNPSGAFTVDLTTIPRASTIYSAWDMSLGGNCGVKWTPHSASFRYKLEFKLGSWKGTTEVIHPNTTSTYTYTGYPVPLDVAKQIPSSDKGTMTVTLYTYSDSAGTKQVGNADTETFTVTVPDLPPTVSMTLSPVSSLPSAFSGMYIQGKTKVKASITATGEHGATIKSYSFKADGKSYGQSADYTSDYLSQYGNITVTGYATDSRNDTGAADATIYVHPYTKPILSDITVGRCNSSRELKDNGTYLLIKAKMIHSSVDGKNKCAIQYRYKALSDTAYSAWTTVLNKVAVDTEIITAPLLNGTLSVKVTYEVQVRAIDDIGEYSYTTVKIPTDKIFCHRGWNSIAYGGYIEEDNTFAITGDMKFKVKNEAWEDLGLSDLVSPSSTHIGRGPDFTGCWYRVSNGNHVQIAFNCAVEHTGTAVKVNLNSIPEEYRSPRNIFSLCAVNGQAIATVQVNNSGEVFLFWIQDTTVAGNTTNYSVTWVDGYIDYYL